MSSFEDDCRRLIAILESSPCDRQLLVDSLNAFFSKIELQSLSKPQHDQFQKGLERLQGFSEMLQDHSLVGSMAAAYDNFLTADYSRPEVLTSILQLLYLVEDISEHPQGKTLCGKQFIGRLAMLCTSKLNSLRLERAAAEALCALITRSSQNQHTLVTKKLVCSKLFNVTLPRCGDFHLQATISEILYRLTRKEQGLLERIDNAAAREAMQSLHRMKKPHVISELRKFVFIINSSVGSSKSVRSFGASRISVDDYAECSREQCWLHLGRSHLSFYSSSPKLSSGGDARLVDVYYNEIEDLKGNPSSLVLHICKANGELPPLKVKIEIFLSAEEVVDVYEIIKPKVGATSASRKASVGIFIPVPKRSAGSTSDTPAVSLSEHCTLPEARATTTPDADARPALKESFEGVRSNSLRRWASAAGAAAAAVPTTVHEARTAPESAAAAARSTVAETKTALTPQTAAVVDSVAEARATSSPDPASEGVHSDTLEHRRASAARAAATAVATTVPEARIAPESARSTVAETKPALTQQAAATVRPVVETRVVNPPQVQLPALKDQVSSAVSEARAEAASDTAAAAPHPTVAENKTTTALQSAGTVRSFLHSVARVTDTPNPGTAPTLKDPFESVREPRSTTTLKALIPKNPLNGPEARTTAAATVLESGPTTPFEPRTTFAQEPVASGVPSPDSRNKTAPGATGPAAKELEAVAPDVKGEEAENNIDFPERFIQKPDTVIDETSRLRDRLKNISRGRRRKMTEAEPVCSLFVKNIKLDTEDQPLVGDYAKDSLARGKASERNILVETDGETSRLRDKLKSISRKEKRRKVINSEPPACLSGKNVDDEVEDFTVPGTDLQADMIFESDDETSRLRKKLRSISRREKRRKVESASYFSAKSIKMETDDHSLWEDDAEENDFMLLARLLQKFKRKVESRVQAKTVQILDSTFDKLKSASVSVEQQIRADAEEYLNEVKHKYGELEARLQEEGSKFKQVYEVFCEEVKKHRRFLDDITAQTTRIAAELGALSDNRRIAQRRLICQTLKASEEQLAEAERRVQTVRRAAAEQTQSLKNIAQQVTLDD